MNSGPRLNILSQQSLNGVTQPSMVRTLYLVQKTTVDLGALIQLLCLVFPLKKQQVPRKLGTCLRKIIVIFCDKLKLSKRSCVQFTMISRSSYSLVWPVSFLNDLVFHYRFRQYYEYKDKQRTAMLTTPSRTPTGK